MRPPRYRSPWIPGPLTFRPAVSFCLSWAGLRLRDASSWRILRPTKQCWQLSKDRPVSALSCFVAIWRGMESPTVTFPASFSAGLGMFQLMSKDGHWQERPLGFSRFISQEQFRPWALSTQRQQCFRTLRNPSEGGTLDYLSWGRPCRREFLATSIWSPGKTLEARTVVWMEKILGPTGLTLSE